MTRHHGSSGGGVRSATTSRSSSSRSGAAADAESLLRLPAVDVADRLGAMLASERRPHYRCRDYLGRLGLDGDDGDDGGDDGPPRPRRPRPPAPAGGSSSSSPSSSSRSRRRRRREASSSDRRSGGAPAAIYPSARARIVRWLYDCADYLDLSRECVAVAASLVDRFASLGADDDDGGDDGGDGDDDGPAGDRRRRHRRAARDARRDAASYQLLAVAGLLIASKQLDGHRATGTVDADVLGRLGRGSCTPDEILEAEATLLDALEWRVCAPTALGIAGHLVALLADCTGGRGRGRDDDDDGSRLASVADFARLQVELSVADYAASASRLPSEVALAAVLNAVDLLDFASRDRRRFGRAVLAASAGALDVRSARVARTRDDLHRVFDGRSDGMIARRAALAAKGGARGGPGGRVGGGSAARSGGGRADAGHVTPRSSRSSARRGRGWRPRPSPVGVDVGIGGRAKLEP